MLFLFLLYCFILFLNSQQARNYMRFQLCCFCQVFFYCWIYKALPREQEQWAQCDSCSKWRRLTVDILVPAKWVCSDNIWDSNRFVIILFVGVWKIFVGILYSSHQWVVEIALIRLRNIVILSWLWLFVFVYFPDVHVLILMRYIQRNWKVISEVAKVWNMPQCFPQLISMIPFSVSLLLFSTFRTWGLISSTSHRFWKIDREN